MDIIKNYSKTQRLQKQNHATLWKEKIDQWEEPAENVWYCNIISCDDKNCKLKLYKGIIETAFNKRYANHKKIFNVEKNKNDTKLCTKYWKLRHKKFHAWISWRIKSKYKSDNQNWRRWSLENSRWSWRNVIKQTLRNDVPVSPSK